MSYNTEIDVTSFYFQNSRVFPRRVEFEGQSLNFLETGLRCLVRKGAELVQIFNMSDGQKLYRLSFEPGSRTWKLLSSRAL
jgi:hypothetical protein